MQKITFHLQKLFFLNLLPLICLAGLAQAALVIPPFQGDVLDQAHILKPDEIQALQLKIKALRDMGGVWMAVYTTPELQGTTIEEISNQTFTAWKLGQKDKNNGLLLVIAPQARKMRFEVGYGLEEKLTDAMTKQIEVQTLIPSFKNRQYSAGILHAIDGICSVYETKCGIEVTTSAKIEKAEEDKDLWVNSFGKWPYIVVVLIFLIAELVSKSKLQGPAVSIQFVIVSLLVTGLTQFLSGSLLAKSLPGTLPMNIFAVIFVLFLPVSALSRALRKPNLSQNQTLAGTFRLFLPNRVSQLPPSMVVAIWAYLIFDSAIFAIFLAVACSFFSVKRRLNGKGEIGSVNNNSSESYSSSFRDSGESGFSDNSSSSDSGSSGGGGSSSDW